MSAGKTIPDLFTQRVVEWYAHTFLHVSLIWAIYTLLGKLRKLSSS